MVSMVGDKTINYIKGIFFILAGILILIPVFWKARAIISDSSKLLFGEKRELGGALYIGWNFVKTEGAIAPGSPLEVQHLCCFGISLLSHIVLPPGRAGVERRTQGPSMSMGMEIMGIALGVIGLINTILVCALPTWMETTFIAANFGTKEVVWDGLWMSCVKRSTSQMQCEVYDSMPSSVWSSNLQAARAMNIITIILGFLGVMVSMVGDKTINYIKGIFFILAGILILIPVSWKARAIISDSSKLLFGVKRELGGALYIGWVGAAFLLIGGVILRTTLYKSRIEVAGFTTVTGWIISMVPCACALGMLDLLQYRALVLLSLSCFSIMFGFLGLILGLFGSGCIKRNMSKAEVSNSAGILFIMAGIAQLIITSFVALDMTQNSEPENVLRSDALMFSAELSRWAASLLLIGGTILCCCVKKKIFKKEKPKSTIDSNDLNRVLHDLYLS
ncbi:unnamed protein product [Coregonus sp. 'balchen']|nr:unnamed protein product [Coregonus sp. 'balchen']